MDYRTPMRAAEPSAGVVALMLLATTSCQPSSPPKPAARVVSLSRLGSEFVLHLDAAKYVVAIGAESRDLEALAMRPVTTGRRAEEHAPTLILVSEAADSTDWTAARLADWTGQGIEVIEVDPHDFSDAYQVLQKIGRHLGIAELARARTHELGDPLGYLSSATSMRDRPRVIPLISLDPLELAGGHSTLSDLVQVAGGETTTHDLDVARVPVDRAAVSTLRAEVLRVARPHPPDVAERELAHAIAPSGTRVEFVELDERSLWLGRPIDTACEVWRRIAEPELRSGEPTPCSTP